MKDNRKSFKLGNLNKGTFFTFEEDPNKVYLLGQRLCWASVIIDLEENTFTRVEDNSPLLEKVVNVCWGQVVLEGFQYFQNKYEEPIIETERDNYIFNNDENIRNSVSDVSTFARLKIGELYGEKAPDSCIELKILLKEKGGSKIQEFDFSTLTLYSVWGKGEDDTPVYLFKGYLLTKNF